ncbi:ankyrin repeat protein [Legionella beliardensis]|uniref:Ankyrin repeat protein n=1 Tax=Legionella beliardensis TaxID=91822 RepID=A0A378I4L4_9GAMM|nr:ankyrin repeat domain-containing protein [Legionella beliardensis]STX29772.1 ankyrin repeat protein [Legionella beliardensis]
MIIKNLTSNSWDDLKKELTLVDDRKDDPDQQRKITDWCKKYIKSDFEFESLDQAKKLIDKYFAFNQQPLSAVIHEAASLGFNQFLDQALELEINNQIIDAQNEHGNTPLHLAAKHAQLKTVQCLLNHDANANITNKSNNIPLNLVTRKRSEPIDTLLFENLLKATSTQSLRLGDNTKRSPILNLVASDNFALIQQVLEKNPDAIDDKATLNENILHLAIKQPSNQVVKGLIDEDKGYYKQLILQRTSEQSTVLHLAARYNPTMMPTLLNKLQPPAFSKGQIFDLINKRDNRGRTVLHVAAKEHPELIPILVERLKSSFNQQELSNLVNKPDNNDRTALYYLKDNDESNIKLLKNIGAEQDNAKDTALLRRTRSFSM